MDLYEILESLEERVRRLENQRAIDRMTYDRRSGDPAAPAAGKIVLYFKSDGKLYYKREDGTVVLVV